MTADPHNPEQDTTPDDAPETAAEQTPPDSNDTAEATDRSPGSHRGTSVETSTVPAGRSRPSGGKGVAWLALLLSLGCAAWLGWQWWQNDNSDPAAALDRAQVRAMITSDLQALTTEQASALSRQDQARQSLADTLARLETDVTRLSQRDHSALENRVDDLDRRIDTQQQSIDQQLSRLGERVQRLATAYASLSVQLTGTDHLDRTLAEVSSQLNLANNYLLIHADSSVARSLISQSQRQLDAHAEPLLSGVRQELARVAQSLDRVLEPDLAVLTGVLAGLTEESARWPMLSERRARNDEHNQVRPDEDDDSTWSRFKQTLSGLVVIRRDQTGDTALLSLREEELLRENMRLQLQVAQLAAVRRDQTLYLQSLDQVDRWMSRYLDVEASVVQSARARLEELRGTTLRPDLPDLSAVLAELNRARGALQTLDQVPPSTPAIELENES